jgi:hypothetical protein
VGTAGREAVFDTADPQAIAATLTRFVADRLGQPVGEAVLYRPGVGVVAGLRLADGTEVLVKVHRWNVDLARLRAGKAVQEHLASLGLPAPGPLTGPEPLGKGIATIEELVAGERADGHHPAVALSVAKGLHELVSTCRALRPVPAVGDALCLRPAGAPLWPEPHDLRFDFEKTKNGAGWIDELAEVARERLDMASGERVVGHFDWRVENLAFKGRRIVAIYDWDSLGLAPEPVVVGTAAAQFSADWTAGASDPLPSVEEMRSFVEHYERARLTPFSAGERELLDASNLYLCAYGARCEHSDMRLHPELVGARPPWQRLLRGRGTGAVT